jgi:hypothetical protein
VLQPPLLTHPHHDTRILGSLDRFAAWSDVHRGDIGDARASSRGTLEREFIYDYNSTIATPFGAVGLWMDARDAEDCPAVDAYRASLATASPLPPPSPASDCPPRFGNLDVRAVPIDTRSR